MDWFSADVHPDHLSNVLAAMANTRHGGTVILGVDPMSTEIQGIHDPADTIDRVLQAALTLTPPLIIPVPQVTLIADQRVLRVEIPAGMPHVYAYDGRYLIRDGPVNRPLPPPDLRRLLIERGEISFELQPAPNMTLADLDWEQVQAYIHQVGGIDRTEEAITRFLVKRGCLIIDGSSYIPTYAGILLFGKEVGATVRGAEITAVRFAGATMSDSFTRHDLIGTLPQQIRRAELFLRDHLQKAVNLHDTMQRAERYEYPIEAARELVVNAVAHRDYSISGDGIRLYLFKDRLEITSPGRLPGPVTISNIVEERFSRNPAIVQVLADLGFIERLGYGVDRVIELLRHQGLRPPEFTETSGGFRVTIYNNPAQNQAEVVPVIETPEPEPPPRPVLSPEAIAILEEYREIALNPRQEAALIQLHQPGNTRITNSELQRMYPDVHAETIRRDLSDLVAKQLIVKMGQKRGSYYVLKRDAHTVVIPSEIESETGEEK